MRGFLIGWDKNKTDQNIAVNFNLDNNIQNIQNMWLLCIKSKPPRKSLLNKNKILHWLYIWNDFGTYFLKSIYHRIRFVFCPSPECFTHTGTSLLPVKGFSVWQILRTHGHWAVRVLERATPAARRNIR